MASRSHLLVCLLDNVMFYRDGFARVVQELASAPHGLPCGSVSSPCLLVRASSPEEREDYEQGTSF